MSVDLSKGATVELVKTLSDDIRTKADETKYNSAGDAMRDKANVNGAYESMTVGNAEQLISSVYEEDSVPYIFRTSGGSIDIGDREEDTIVGGTVAFNQLNPNPKFDNGTTGYQSAGGTFAVSNGIATVTINTTISHNYDCRIQRGISTGAIKDHIYYGIAVATLSKNGKLRCYGGQMTGNPLEVDVTANTYKEFGCVVKCNANSTGAMSVSLGSDYANFGTGDVLYIKSLLYIDLTQMFGSTIADYIYSLETANAGAGAQWFKKLFPKPYYAYNAGELMHVSGLSAHKMVGFNIVDESKMRQGSYNNTASTTYICMPEYIPAVPNTVYFWHDTLVKTGNARYVNFYDSNKDSIDFESKVNDNKNFTFITPANTAYIRFNIYNANGISIGEATGKDFCINISWDGERDGEYEPYVEHVYPLDDSLTLRGIPKLDSDNNLYYDGDIYESDGTVTRKYGIVDLGTLNWNLIDKNGHGRFGSTTAVTGAPTTGGTNTNLVNAKYIASGAPIGLNGEDKAIALYNGIVYIRDDGYSDTATFKTAMSGVYLVYELATPTTEEAEPYQNPQIVDDFGTEEYVSATNIVPVGHETKYRSNLKSKLEMAPDSPSDGNNDYIVRQSNGANAYIPLGSASIISDLVAKLPTAPSENGSYTLTVTVNNGTVTYSWES